VREPLQQHHNDPYERPNQNWLCGLDGEPCPMGPGARGRCPVATACHPVREGDRWRCNRSNQRGGPCDKGPSPTGECCHVYQCSPLRSLRARRGRFVVGCCLVVLGALCVLLSADWRNEVLAPGKLSVHHAQILNRGDKTDRCASCHAAGSQSFGQWMQHAVDENLANPSQTNLCLECHAKQIPREWATAAHNVAPDMLQLTNAQATTSDRKVDPLQSFACATCHREHHGTEYDLTKMSDNACQACHKEQYHSFADGHPEFEKWPANRRTRIAFDHAAHQAKHFPKEKQEFACAACHQQAVDGDFQRTLDYEATCAKCHDRDMQVSWEKGIPLLSLPMLEIAAFEDAGLDVGTWPEDASDEFDGALPPLAKLLLLADPNADAALKTLGVDFDFFDVDPTDDELLQAAADIVQATKKLLSELATSGHTAISARVSAVLGREISQHELAELVAHLTPESLAVIDQQWLSADPVEATNDTDSQLVSGGGWFRDDLTLSIRYLPSGHDDPWLASWIDVLTEATAGPHSEAAETLLKGLMKPTAAGQCGSCHSVDRESDGRLAVQWLAKQAANPNAEFTKFSHRPHLTQAELIDCQACHQIDSSANVMASYAELSHLVFEQGFRPITKQQCAECHKADAAGASCLQCHRYHVGSQTTEPGSHVFKAP